MVNLFIWELLVEWYRHRFMLTREPLEDFLRLLKTFDYRVQTFCDRRNKQMKIENFEDLPLTPEVMKGIEELGFTELFPIQAQAMIPLLEGKDVIGQAQTGTGKTAAFGIPMVERVDPKNKRVQGLVLAPTRELAIQVAQRISRFSKYTRLKVLPVYGGESIGKRRPHCCWYARSYNRPSKTRNIKSIINESCCS
jgi:ATP-dependent helicase YprA (DUF1998 family)